MKINRKNFLVLFLLFTLVVKSVSISFFPAERLNEIESKFKQLSNLFGNETVICASAKDENIIHTTYKKLGENEQRNFLKNFDITLGSHKNLENYILTSGFSKIFKLEKSSFWFLQNSQIITAYFPSSKRAQAPPAIS